MAFTILSTKKLNTSVHEQLEQDGLQLIVEEFITIQRSVPATAIEKISLLKDGDVVIFTSANAVEAIKSVINRDLRLRIFCISGKTKEAVIHTFHNASVIATAANGKKLGENIIASGITTATFICGNIRRDELPIILAQNKIALEEIAVYNTIETPKLIKQKFDGVIFFSPSEVSSSFSTNQLASDVVCFSIGNTTATEIKKFANNHIIVAENPTQESLAAAINQFTNQRVQS